MFTFLAWVFLSFLVALIGMDKTIGFWGSFILSLLLSPVIGLIIVIVSKSNASVAARNKAYKLQEETLFAIKDNTKQLIAEELRKLADLKQAGVLTEEEFITAKTKLLNNPSP